jgi:nicotinate-nucleotide pyrophosphorylase
LEGKKAILEIRKVILDTRKVIPGLQYILNQPYQEFSNIL